MTKYNRVEDYEDIIFGKNTILRIACCDCGLVHDTIIADEGKGLHGFASVRNNRATAQLRRHKYGFLHNGIGKYKLVKNYDK